MEKTLLDVDDSLGEFLKPLNNYYNETRGTDFCFEDYWTYSLHEIWECSEGEAADVIHEFYKTLSFERMKPLKFSQEALRMLRLKREFIAVSYRPEMLVDLTREWIADTFFGMETLCVGSYDFSGPVETKLSICKRLGVDSLVEDNAKTASECAGAGITAVVLSKPWNINVSYNGFRRVSDWNAVPEFLD